MRKHNPYNEISPGIIKADIVTAQQSISYFKTHKIKDIKNIAAYHLQQATEKLIKIQLYDSSVQLQNSKLYTHNIEALLAYADENQISLIVPEYIRDNALNITKWESGSRYGLGLSLRIDSLEKCCNIILNWYEEVV